MGDLLGLVLAGVLGGGVAVLFMGFFRRAQAARSGRGLARALARELGTARFDRADDEVRLTSFRSAVFATIRQRYNPLSRSAVSQMISLSTRAVALCASS